MKQLILLVCCATVVVVDGSRSASISPELDGQVFINATDLEIETVSDWRLGRYFTSTETVLRRLARNFLKLTKILIFKDERCARLISLDSGVRTDRFDMTAGIRDGALNLLNVLVVRAERNKVGDTKFRESLTLARDFLKDDEIVSLDLWISGVYGRLEALLSDEGLNLFGIKKKEESDTVFVEIKRLIEAGIKKAFDHPYSEQSGDEGTDESPATEMNHSNGLAAPAPPVPQKQWSLEDIQSLGPMYVKEIHKDVPNSKPQALENFAQIFWFISKFIGSCNNLISSGEEDMRNQIANFVVPMIEQDLLPHLEKLIENETSTTRDASFVYAGMRMAKDNLLSYLPNVSEGRMAAVVVDIGRWTSEIYKNLSPLFQNGKLIVGQDLDENWTAAVLEMYNDKSSSVGNFQQ